MEKKELKKEFDLDEIDMKWEDEIFPEEKMLGAFIIPEKNKKPKK